ncbi:beta-N-acetylhexosaminidase [Chitinophaga barathri]|uniref:beta-N-acetylhexosaminidase n=1 Tax=Chitinophaga barathri TaxID=1647451 RepID=A0A3N4M628_9BACT|nr:beta-N-acetylhexosaminidase [Chitinophaga barathri]RPD38671.1 beta-N-acetylhexosaminidase [Chitinophaga barathri]
MKSFLFGCIVFICAASPLAAQNISILPVPAKTVRTKGSFVIKQSMRIVAPDTALAKLLAASVRELTGIDLKTAATGPGSIYFLQGADSLGNEGYRLEILPGRINIISHQPAGWFYGIQSLLQLLPAERGIPCMEITDRPRFAWRGLMLDVSRHFFSKAVILSYIDQMAKYKLNTFHLHLTDNQGWRIEIKSMPKLTSVGAWRVPRTGYWKGMPAPAPGEAATDGGFYSQDDIREMVQYAAKRFVTIVPEIDVPGHSLALIASYPELSCTKQPQQVLAGDPWNTSRANVLCAGNDSIYAALDKIFTEVAALFPGEYIHVGGDEVQRIYWNKCPHCKRRINSERLKSAEALQTYFIGRVAKIVESKGKKVMGWYENLDSSMVPGMAQMSWKNTKGGALASQAGHKVVMTPAFFTYLDFYQNDPSLENGPFTVCRLSSCYAFDPLADGALETNVLGGQGSLWTEQVPNERKLQYMTWPRALALAEVLWSPRDSLNWPRFTGRMEAQFPRFDRAGVKYATAYLEPLVNAVIMPDSTYCIRLAAEVEGLDIHYSFDDTSPDNFYPRYTGAPVAIPKGAHHIRVISYRQGRPAGRELNLDLAELTKKAARK